VNEEVTEVESTETPAVEVTETVEPAGETSAAFPSSDTFGWDDWDGETGTLPEPVRGWGERFSTHYKARFDRENEAALEETARMKEIYETLMEGAEDPRNAELTQQLEELQKKFSGLEETSKTTRAEYEAYKQAREEADEREAQEFAKRFEDAHPEIFKDAAKAKRFLQLLEAGWELDYAPAALELSEGALAIAQEALNEGTPMRYALKLAEAASPQPQRRKPRPGARITSGATRAPVAPHQAPKDALREARSLDDIRRIAAQRAMKRS